MPGGSYAPFQPARRPGRRPSARPQYRVLVHRQYADDWEQLPRRVGLESALQFWDHVADTLGQPPSVGSASILRGKRGEPQAPGFSRTVHYEISGAGRINYQYHDAYAGGARGDPHPVVCILSIEFGSH